MIVMGVRPVHPEVFETDPLALRDDGECRVQIEQNFGQPVRPVLDGAVLVQCDSGSHPMIQFHSAHGYGMPAILHRACLGYRGGC